MYSTRDLSSTVVKRHRGSCKKKCHDCLEIGHKYYYNAKDKCFV